MRWFSRFTWSSAFFLCVLLACGGDPSDPLTIVPQLERELLAAHDFELDYSISSSGAFESSLTGSLSMSTGNVLHLTASGTFGGEAVDAMIRSDGDSMLIVVADDSAYFVTPNALNEAVVIGMTRMGLLHNLARLTTGAAPDRAGGSVAEWVVLSGFTEGEERAGKPGFPVSFQLTVDGVPSGEATLWTDTENWLPVLREQTVNFPQGTMLVTERYSW